MNRRHIIKICFVLVFVLWLTVGALSYRIAINQELNANYYDKQMSKKEFEIRKEQKLLALTKNVTEAQKLDSIEELAKNSWTTFRAQDATKLLEYVRDKREKLYPQYNQKLINTLLLLAAVYRDTNLLIPSAQCYERIWKLDQENLSADDGRLLRDQTNMTMLDFVRGDSDPDEAVRHRFFQNSINHIACAKEIWHKQKNPDPAALANLFYYEYLCNRELGNKTASRAAYGEMKYLNRSLKRAYTPPWT